MNHGHESLPPIELWPNAAVFGPEKLIETAGDQPQGDGTEQERAVGLLFEGAHGGEDGDEADEAGDRALGGVADAGDGFDPGLGMTRDATRVALELVERVGELGNGFLEIGAIGVPGEEALAASCQWRRRVTVCRSTPYRGCRWDEREYGLHVFPLL
jgi:hypothetical protein